MEFNERALPFIRCQRIAGNEFSEVTMNIIGAFSSDFRPLYKADIYRALALPVGHVLHFRYKRKYVDDNLISNPSSVKNQRVVIFYTHGNKAGDGNLTHVPIREAAVVDFEESKETDVVHVYMKLGDFCNYEVDTGNSIEKKPPNKFFAELHCTKKTNDTNWQSRVTAVESLLPQLTYFQIKGISIDGKRLSLSSSDCGRACFYRLLQGKRHVLHLALGNPSSVNAKINLQTDTDIALNIVRPVETSVQFDDIDIPLIVQHLQVFRKPSLITSSR